MIKNKIKIITVILLKAFLTDDLENSKNFKVQSLPPEMSI